jgi:hypothetical protein
MVTGLGHQRKDRKNMVENHNFHWPHQQK